MRADSPDGDRDLLPGLCAFATAWLANAALPGFRDTADVPPPDSLTGYYEVPPRAGLRVGPGRARRTAVTALSGPALPGRGAAVTHMHRIHACLAAKRLPCGALHHVQRSCARRRATLAGLP